MKDQNITLCLQNGTRISLSATGAAIHEVLVPDRHNGFANIVLTPAFPWDGSYAGATLAPFAGRIENSLLPVGEQSYLLWPNEGKHQLHGGAHNLSSVEWEVVRVSHVANDQSCCFRALAKNGLDGFPGNRLFTVTYRLWHENRLDILFEAETDCPTRVNLSNHAYWSLSGVFAERAALSQHLQVNANAYYHNNEEHIAQEMRPVCGTAFDFRKPIAIGERQELLHGFNHAFLLASGLWDAYPAATLSDPLSGRRLRLYTDQPSLRLYSGGYLAVPSCAIALEAEALPNGLGTLLTPQAPYQRHISLRFDTF